MLQDNCFTSLVNLIDNLGGVPIDPSITFRLTDNFLFSSLEPPKGLVTGVEISRYLLDPKCVDCSDVNVENTEFTPGVWTTAVASPLDKEIEGVTYYWIPVSTDVEGNGWFVDMYNICTITGNLSPVESRISLAMDGSFQGLIGFQGVKVAILYKLTPNSLIQVATYYNLDKSLPRTNTKLNTNQFNLEYNNKDQISSLEDLSIGMLYLLKNNYVPNEKNTIKHYSTLDVDPLYSRTLSKVTEQLVSLIDTQSVEGKRLGSIPAHLLTFTSKEALYNDELYASEFVSFLAESENQISYTAYDFVWSVPYSENNVLTSTEGESDYLLVEEGLELIDTLTISSQALVSRYSSVLDKGMEYVIRVSGLIDDGTNTIDAAYYSVTGDFSDATVITPSFGTGLFIEGVGFYDSSTGYKADHIYDKLIIGDDSALRFSILENNSYTEDKTDNSGFFTVEIYRKNYRFIVDDGVDTLLNTVLYSSDLTIEKEVNVKFYRNNCLEDKCYTIKPNDLLTDRTVLNSSVAWFLIYLIEYSLLFNLDYSDEINLLTNYLSNQIAPNKRMYKGWTDNAVLAESQRIEESDLYTDVVCMIAFAYSYGQSLNTHQLYLAASLNRSILDNHYLNQLLVGKDESETVVSSLLYAEVMKRLDIKEKADSYLRARVNWRALTDNEEKELLTIPNTYSSLMLSFSNLDLTAVEETIVLNKNQFSLLARCLSDDSLFDVSQFPFTEINQVFTYQNYLNSFLEELPTDYGWFSFEALTKGTIKSVLSSMLNVIAPLFGRAYSTKRYESKSNELSINLQQLELEYGIQKPRGMSLSDFKQFIFTYFDGGSNQILLNLLSQFSIKGNISNTANEVLTLNGNLNLGTPYLNKGFLPAAPQYSNNSFLLTVNKHLSNFFIDLLNNSTTAGTAKTIKEELVIAAEVSTEIEETELCVGINEGISIRQLLLNRNYTENQIDLLLDNLEFCLEEIGLNEDQIEIYKYDPRPFIDRFANCSIFA